MKLILIFILVIIFITFIIDMVGGYSNINNITLKNPYISVIILNYNRPHNVKKVVNKLLDYNIDEIIISNGKKETEIIFKHENVINETILRNKYYSATRFELSQYAKNDIILFLDDDLYPSIELINTMLTNYEKFGKNNLYSPFMRSCNKNGYKCRRNNIGLTKMAMVNKNVAINIWNKMKKSPYFKFVMEHKGNGEDILFATFINKTGGKSIFSNGKYTNLDYTNGYSSNKDHYKIRSEFCKQLHTLSEI